MFTKAQRKAYAREIGKKGGKTPSWAKAEAARINGRRGGRPKSKSMPVLPAGK